MKTAHIIAFIIALLTSSAAQAQPTNHHNSASLSTNTDVDIDDEGANYNDDNDPIEPVNRAVFKFNTVIDNMIFHPVATGYRAIVPQWGRQRVSNVFYNISEPVTVVNSVLQADPENAFTSLWRFIINSTFGLLGTFDPATDIGLKARQEDFGQTLGVWGFTNSPYLVLPIIGPSTLRDGVGLIADYYTNPFYNGMIIEDKGIRWGLLAVRYIDLRASLLNVTDDIDRTSVDRYATYRSAFLQKRAHDINNGKE